jgi:hypothetical protein
VYISGSVRVTGDHGGPRAAVNARARAIRVDKVTMNGALRRRHLSALGMTASARMYTPHVMPDGIRRAVYKCL